MLKLRPIINSLFEIQNIGLSLIVQQTQTTPNQNQTNTQTDTLLTRGRYVYDVELSFVDSSSNTIIERILEGNIEVSPSVTKP